MESSATHLNSLIKLFEYYRSLGLKTIEQVSDDGLFWQCNADSNSIAVIVKHLHGNMLSRWTDFLTTDGEKTWRDRDGEFESTTTNREELLTLYHAGWESVFNAVRQLTEADLNKTIYIRNMGHTVYEAIHRQVAHYAYHIGQIVFIGKQIQGAEWQTLSIAKNASKTYNQKKFSKEKDKRHFTEDL